MEVSVFSILGGATRDTTVRSVAVWHLLEQLRSKFADFCSQRVISLQSFVVGVRISAKEILTNVFQQTYGQA